MQNSIIEKKLSLAELHDLFILYENKLITFAIRKLQNEDEARDIVQDAFANACNRVINHTVLAENPRAWLYQIANNLCINAIAQRRVRENHVVITMGRTKKFEHSVEHTYLGKAILAEVENFAVENLTMREQRVFRLSAFDAQRQIQIARSLGIGKPAVSKILKRIDLKLRAKFPDGIGNF
jgi:RNA polymerase sigma factor (sigma-70 family)